MPNNSTKTKKTPTKKTPTKRRAASKRATKKTVVIEEIQSPDVFDGGSLDQRAIEMARKKWSYNYSVIKATLIATGVMTKDDEGIPSEVEKDVKLQILQDCREAVHKAQSKRINGMPF